MYKIDPHGQVTVFYRGLGRPQGLAFDKDGNLYVAASLGGQRGIVKITPDGAVKVLDFGLAKALDTTPGGNLSNSPTLTIAGTQGGVILGTAA